MANSKSKDHSSIERTMIESLTDGIWRWDIEKDVFCFSSSWKEKLGYKEGEVDNKFDAWKGLVHPEDIDYVLTELFDHLNRKTPEYKIEYRIRKKLGHYIWILDKGKANWNHKDKPIFMVGIYTDIHESKLTEEALKKNERRYKTLIESSPDAVFVHHKEKILFANEKGAQLLGFNDAKKLTGKSVWEFIASDDIERAKGHLDYAWSNKDNIPLREQKVVRKDGNVVYIGLSSTIISYDGQEAILSTMRDISERKKIQEILSKTLKENNELLRKVIEFDRIKTDFFSNMSHEFRTPLNIILGVLQLMNKIEYKDTKDFCYNQLPKYNDMMRQNCYRLLRLINNIIDITKFDANYLRLDVKNHNIVSIIEEITLSVAEYLESKGIDLIFDTNVEEKIVACDVDKIERIMLNLLSNAVKYTQPTGTIKVTIYDKKDRIIISVKDTGEGIPKDKLAVIFHRFRQAESLMTRKKEGSGIGLSLVKYLVEAHGGDISVQSEVGNGSEFIIQIPVKTIDSMPITNNHIKSIKDEKVERVHIEFSDIYS